MTGLDLVMTTRNTFSLREYDEACKELKRLAGQNREAQEPSDNNNVEKREPTMQVPKIRLVVRILSYN